MENKIKEVKNELDDVHHEFDALNIAIKALDFKNQETLLQNKRMFILFLISLLLNMFLCYEFATTAITTTSTETTTTQDGVYNFHDSEGNLISSDLSLEEMQELIEINKGALDGENNSQD